MRLCLLLRNLKLDVGFVCVSLVSLRWRVRRMAVLMRMLMLVIVLVIVLVDMVALLSCVVWVRVGVWLDMQPMDPFGDLWVGHQRAMRVSAALLCLTVMHVHGEVIWGWEEKVGG